MAAWSGVQNFVTVKKNIFLYQEISIHVLAGFLNKGFLFATSGRKIRSHVVESQITLLVWPHLSLTEKQRTINHMIIFNDSISKFYQCIICGFCRGISFLVSASEKKKKKSKTNAEATKFLGILKKYVSNNKICFLLKKKSNVLFNKNVTFAFHTIFKLDFIMQIICCIIHRCLHSLFILYLSSYISF